MDKKTTAVVSYLTIIGWFISFFVYKHREKSRFISYHLKQSFGLFISLLLACLLLFGLVNFPNISIYAEALLYWLCVLAFVYMLIGVINAKSYKLASLPLIGKFFKNKFKFIR